MAEVDNTIVNELIATSEKSLKIDDSRSKSRETSVDLDENLANNINTKQVDTEVDSKSRKKLDKFIEHSFKKSGLNDLKTYDEKFYALALKYSDLIDANKQKDAQLKEMQRTTQAALKQRDQMQQENGKALLAREKLESLCRELQKHNKAIKEENLIRTKEEEEKRKEISAKFQSAIEEINQQVNANTERNNALIQENVQLAAKLKSLIEQYDAREQHMEKVMKHKDLEQQLVQAKFQQSELKVTESKERMKQYEELLGELTKKCEIHMTSEAQLKVQLQVYTEKYEEFQSTLNKSNEVFGSFRSEMDKMTKKIKKLEQETLMWRQKCESSNKQLVQAAEIKENLEKELKKRQTKADTLENLCRTLQNERTGLLQQIKAFEAEKVPPLVTETPSESISDNKA